MKLHGLFLASRAGRRIFWTLLAAAAAPMMLFAALSYDTLRDHFAQQARRQQMQATKYAGLALLDNLVVARTVLGIIARAGVADADARLGNRRGRVLTGVASIDSQGRLLAGNAAVWARWAGEPIEWPGRDDGDTARLVAGHGRFDDDGLPMLMVLRLRGEPDRLWIGEIDRDFLFGELHPEALGAVICVFDGHDHPLYCPRSTPDAADRDEEARRARWSLFLRSDFGIEDWTLVHRGSGAPDALSTVPLMRSTVLGALATLLIVTVLSLVQVRRMTLPLQRLTAGTRRLSARDYAARVQHEADDEFGELARSFNHMAERIGHQVEALQVQAAIDREILGGLDVPRVLQQVARRLGQLVPGAPAAVIEFERRSALLARVHQAEGAFTLVSLRGEALPCANHASAAAPCLCDPLPAAVAGLLSPRLPRGYLHPVRAGGERLALLVVGLSEGVRADDDTLREIAELGARVGVVLAAADRERRLLERAVNDSLTGLANRAGLLEHLDGVTAADPAPPFSLLFIDLDRFKEVNDAMGHEAGDELLRIVAQRLRGAVPAGALVARPGGDEFVVVVPGERSAADALAPRLIERIASPFLLGARQVTVGASIGMAHHPDDGAGASDLLRRADMAMYVAKGEGGNAAAWFTAALDQRLAERTSLVAELRDALARGEFELHYQPRVRTGTLQMRSAEALLRWRHPVRGMVPPGQFIELLEDHGLIDAVGRWAIETACRQLRRWQQQGVAVETVAVNVSTRQLHARDFAAEVLALVARSGLAPAALELEITESIFVGDATQAIATLAALRRAGVRVALDDFGTGYSSLSYLHKLPIDILKVDRSFVAELGSRDSALALTRSIIALARALRLQVVAEGVETVQQAELLADLGCDELQGYLYAPPLEAQAFAARAGRVAEAATS